MEKIQKKSIKAQVYDNILGEIKAGHYKIGDRLPTIRELVDILGVSFSSIRDALTRLEDDGYVELRTGSGCYVRDYRKKLQLSDTVSLCLQTSGHIFSDLYSFLQRELQKHHKFPMGIDIHSADCEEVIESALLSDSQIFVIQGNRYFPFHLFKRIEAKDKQFISILGSVAELESLHAHQILIDHRWSEKLILDYLQKNHHQSAVVIGSDLMIQHAFLPEQERLEETIKVNSIQQAGIKLYALHNDTTVPSGALDADQLISFLEQDDKPRVIIGLRDVEVRLAQNILLEKAPNLLNEISLIGYGNTPHSQLAAKPFSTIDFNLQQIAKEVGDLVEELSANSVTTTKKILVKPSLILR